MARKVPAFKKDIERIKYYISHHLSLNERFPGGIEWMKNSNLYSAFSPCLPSKTTMPFLPKGITKMEGSNEQQHLIVLVISSFSLLITVSLLGLIDQSITNLILHRSASIPWPIPLSKRYSRKNLSEPQRKASHAQQR